MMPFYPQSNAPAQSGMIQHGGAGVVQYALQPHQAQQMIQASNQQMMNSSPSHGVQPKRGRGRTARAAANNTTTTGDKICIQPNCNKMAVSGMGNSEKCKAHGGGSRCTHAGKHSVIHAVDNVDEHDRNADP
jgi:hypothetical protein